MRSRRSFLIAAIALAIFTLSGCGQTPKTAKTSAPADKAAKTEASGTDHKHDHEGSSHEHSEKASDDVAKFANPTPGMCPVSGEPIDPSVTVDLDGKTYAFCCQDCADQFKEDPKKFLSSK